MSAMASELFRMAKYRFYKQFKHKHLLIKNLKTMRNKKCSKYYSLKAVMIVVALFSFASVNAQTFICTDVTFSDYAKKISTEAQLYQVKKNILGAITKLEIFEKNLKVVTEEKDGNTYEYIMDKIGEYKYRYEDIMTNYITYESYKLKVDLEIQTRLGYYLSCTVKTYYDEKLVQTITSKRK